MYVSHLTCIIPVVTYSSTHHDRYSYLPKNTDLIRIRVISWIGMLQYLNPTLNQGPVIRHYLRICWIISSA